MSSFFDGLMKKVKSVMTHEESPLQIAAGAGDLDAVRKLLNDGADINSHSQAFPMPPLAKAARDGQLAVAQLLIELKADVNLGFNDVAPLELALSRENFEIAKLLINNGAAANTKRSVSLETAAYYRNHEIVDLLLSHGAKYEREKGEYGESRLHKSGCAAMLLPRGLGKEDVNARDDLGGTPLHMVENIDDCTQLVEHGADLNALDNAGVSVLAYTIKDMLGGACAALTKRDPLVPLEKVRFLLEHGANVNITSPGAPTPLSEAAGKGEMQMIRLLVDHGADVNLRSDGGDSPAYSAASSNKVEALEFLCAHGADVNQKCGEDGVAPLHIAALSGHVAAMEMLFKHGATDVNVRTDKGGETPLQWVGQLADSEEIKKNAIQWLHAHGAGSKQAK